VRRLFGPAIVVALLLVAGACSGDDAVAPTTTSAPASTRPVPSTTAAAAPTTSTTAPGTTIPPATTLAATTTTLPQPIPPEELVIDVFSVPAGSRPHDVAPAVDGGVWYTAQSAEALGWLDPATGETRHIPLGSGSRPHGVIVDAVGDPWVTDGGLNAIVHVDADGDELTEYPLPDDATNANLNTATFDLDGRLWFTGQNGIYGVLDPASGEMQVFDAPRGEGPYGIHTSPTGDIFYASLAGSYVGWIVEGGNVVELEPPTPDQGSRRVWFDSSGRAWVSEWNTGSLSVYDPATESWTSYDLPGDAPQTYAVYVDDTDIVWVSDFGGNAIHRFDPTSETFTTFPLPNEPGNVRQLLGRPGEVWGAESAADTLIVIRQTSS
jgi:virginiamycin B lyase